MTIRTLSRALFRGLLVVLMGAPGLAFAADYPSKPITILVAFGAGGGTDAFIRAIAEPVSKELGQTILIQNKPGAGGGVAAMAVKSADADGYTLIATGSLTYTFEPQVQKTAYSVDDFTHVAVVNQFQEGLFTHPDRPYTSMRELIDLATTAESNRPA